MQSISVNISSAKVDLCKPDPIQVLAFDVFGTVVDWHGSIARKATQLGIQVDPSAFATAWRAGYKPAMARVRSG